MPFNPEKITKDHVLSAIEKIGKEGIELIDSTKYDVVINGKNYPPKEIMRYAHEEMNGEHIWELSGGNPTNKFLKEMGFEIIEKNTTNKDDLMQLWNEFLERWPLERVKEMTLQEYTSAGSKDTFTYWIEVRLENLGSIWGGASFKFGIYSRDNKDKKENKQGRMYSDKYAWYQKYGKTENEAFSKIRDLIVEVITSVTGNNLSNIDKIDLGESYKWKIASLYQDRKNPQIVMVFNNDALEYISGESLREKTLSMIYEKIISQKSSSQNLFEYSQSIWQKYINQIRIWKVSHGKGDFSSEEREEYLNKKKILVHGNTAKGQGDNFVNAAEVGDYFYLCHGNDQGIILLGKITSEAKDADKGAGWKERDYEVLINSKVIKPYNGINKGWTPNYNSTFMIVKPNELKLFNQEIAVPYFGINVIGDKVKVGLEQSKLSKSKIATNLLNTILYGPPGTGKTYKTIERAVQIIENLAIDELNSKYDSRTDIKKKYQEYFDKGQIKFVTFHQSFSYEDFIEGIKPIIQDETEESDLNNELKYTIEKGVFREIAEDAMKSIDQGEDKKYVLIIDEINRGNIANIFGELITLIEDDKRMGNSEALTAELPYSKKQFSVSNNLYLIGTMNTADRSVEALDTALRRRFTFEQIHPDPKLINPSALVLSLWQKYEYCINWDDEPFYSKAIKLYDFLGFDSDEFEVSEKYYQKMLGRGWNELNLSEEISISEFEGFRPDLMLEKINRRIEVLLDSDHCIGHAYFMKLSDCNDPFEELKEIFKSKILPLLQEYFYGDLAKIGLILGRDFVEFRTVNKTEKLFADFEYENMDEYEDTPIVNLKDIDNLTIESFKKIYE